MTGERTSEHYVVSVPPGTVMADLDEYVASIPPDEARLAQSFVLRMDGSLAAALDSQEGLAERERLVRRAAGKDIACLFPSADGSKVKVRELEARGLTKADDPRQVIARARQGELSRIIDENADQCYFHAGDGYHFVTPAGFHCTHFLRLSDAIRTRRTLDTFAFWLRPRLTSVAGVLLDSWSIVSVLLHALHGRPNYPVFDCLPGHPVSLEGPCRGTVRGLQHRIGQGGKLLLLTSVSSSDTLQRAVREILEDGVFPDTTVECLSIYKFRSSAADALCILEDTPENYFGTENCEHCRQGSAPLVIDPRVYYVRDQNERQVPLRKRHWQIGRQFVSTYGHVPHAFACHVDDPNDGRHHAFAIDVLCLLDDPVFVQSFRANLEAARSETPDLIITPNHTAGRALATIASDVLGAHVIVTNDLRPSSLPEEERNRIEGSQRLFVVDDVVNSGSRLEEFNTSIREDWRGRFDSVTFAIGIARTESEDELRAIEVTLTMNHPWRAQLSFAERLLLPRWSTAECPWCQEFEYLAGVSANLPSPPEWLTERLALLADTNRGIRSTPLLMSPNHRRLTLGAGALAGPEGLAEGPLLFSVASALQSFRHDRKPADRLNPGFPLGNVAGLKNLQNYSEALMRMALLRLVRRREWGTTLRLRIRQFLLTVSRRASQRSLTGELLIAHARKAIAPFESEDFEAVFQSDFPGLTIRGR